MTWEKTELGTVRRSFQDRFSITLEQLDILSLDAQAIWNEDCLELQETTAFKQGFAKELLACIGEHLSINDLNQIVELFGEELGRREVERQKFVLQKEVKK